MSNSLKLEFVRIYLGDHRMDVGLSDVNHDEKRLVAVTWNQVPPTDIPPENWYATACGEVAFQRSQELLREKGLFVPME